MKVVVIAPSIRVGGAERSLVKLVGVIVPAIARIHVLCLSGADKALISELPAETDIVFLNGYGSSNPIVWLQVYSQLRVLKPDVVIGWSTYANLVAIMATRFLPGTKVVLSERNYVPKMFGPKNIPPARRRILLALMRRLYRKADIVTANSIANVRFLKKYIGAGPAYKLLPNVIDYREMEHRAKCDVPALLHEIRGPKILAVGRIVHQKGFDILLDAMRLVQDAYPWPLVIVGDGPQKCTLLRKAEQLGLKKKVHWIGMVPNPFPFYRWADIVVVPSRFEGFPNVALEAMAMRTAVICSDCDTGPRELTGEGRFGMLVPTGDAKALAAAIIALGLDADRRNLLGECARNHVLKNYDAKVMRNTYLQALGIE